MFNEHLGVNAIDSPQVNLSLFLSIFVAKSKREIFALKRSVIAHKDLCLISRCEGENVQQTAKCMLIYYLW